MCPRSSTPRVMRMFRKMPRRSSRSRPASLTSLSEPTGSASLAIAMSCDRTLTIRAAHPVVGCPDFGESGPGRLVAESAVDARLVEGARVEPERGRGLVVALEVGVEHRRIVGRDRAAHAGRDEPRQGVVGERADRAGADVRERADVEHDPASGELADEPRILLGADAVTQPVGAERLERAAHGGGACDLARMRDGAEPERLRPAEDVLVRLGRELRLEPAESDADDAAVAVARRPLDRRKRHLLREAARDVRREADLDAVQLLRLLRAVADPLIDLLPGAAPA